MFIPHIWKIEQLYNVQFSLKNIHLEDGTVNDIFMHDSYTTNAPNFVDPTTRLEN